jgi:ubiquitin carboxyl-terminal hydrolase 22/27/51
MSQKELAGYAQQDAHEFFISALNNIHAGCEGHKLSNCDCIIHKTFAGLLQSNVTCLRCKNITTTCDPMLDISLGLKPPEKKKANRSLNGRRFSHDERSSKQGNTLKDCLERYTQPEKLGANEYSCSKCGYTFQVVALLLLFVSHHLVFYQEATKQLSIKRIPPVLSIQLKVFLYNHS